MATQLTTRAEIPEEVSNIYIKEHLMMAEADNYFDCFARKLTIENNKGSRTVKVRRYNTLNPALNPLVEGQTPTGSKASVVTISKTLSQYGDFLTFTDVLETESIDDTLLDFCGVLGSQRGETKDILCRLELMQGTNVVYGGGKTARNALTATDTITADMLDKMEETLKINKTKKITTMISATDRVSTVPVNACFVGFCSVNAGYQIKALPKFVPVEKYASTTNTFPGEIGKHGDIRFIESNNTETLTGAGAGGINVEQFVVFGREAYGSTPMEGTDGEIIIKNLGEGEDALNQRGTAGWKMTTAFVRLNEAFIARGEVAHKS